MITHFIPALGIVENYPNIVIYRDHEDPYTFYYLNTRPRVTIDTETKKPVFDYMVIGRNIKREGSEGVQEGRLVMSVNLALTEDKNGKKGELSAVEEKVRNFVQGSTFLADLKKNYPNYDNKKYQTTRVETYRTRWFVKTVMRVENIPRQVNIKPVEFIDGTASINLASSDFAGKFTHETKPTLFGDCNATIAVNLDSQESQILYQIFKPQSKKDDTVNLSATVNYSLKYKTIVPFHATAKIDYTRIYSEFQDLNHSNAAGNGISKQYRRFRLGRSGTLTVGYYYSNGKDLYISKEDLDNFLRNSDTAQQNITIKIEDYNGSDNEKYEQIILDAVSKQLANQVCDKLFEKVQPLSPSDVLSQNNAVSTDGNDSSETDTKKDKKNALSDVAYRLRNDIQTSVSDNYTITIEKNKIVDYEANPNGSLELIVKNDNKALDISSFVRELDASDIYFQSRVVDYLIYEGPTDPTITGSLGNTFSYKGWHLNLFATYSFGNKVRLDPAFHASYSDLDAMPKEFKNRWTMAGDENYTDIPVIADLRQRQQDTYLSYAYNAFNRSTARVAKGDFIRMKEISLSYDFPKAWISHLSLNTLSAKLQATNLFLIYSDKKLNGQDPEFFNNGGVAVPMSRQFTFTLRIGL